MVKASVLFAIASASLAIATPHLALAEGDAAAGATSFTQCSACHSVQPGKVLVGPSLYGVVGRKVGGASGYHYSAALMNAVKTWTTASLNTFLTDPGAMYPGTKMLIKVTNPEVRENIVAYLKSISPDAK